MGNIAEALILSILEDLVHKITREELSAHRTMPKITAAPLLTLIKNINKMITMRMLQTTMLHMARKKLSHTIMKILPSTVEALLSTHMQITRQEGVARSPLLVAAQSSMRPRLIQTQGNTKIRTTILTAH